MAPLVTIALLVGAPVVLIFLLRANAAMVFLALCAGSVLTQFISSDATNILRSFIPASGTVNFSIIQLSLLYAPAFFTVLFMRKGVAGAKTLINLIPAAATGAVGALLAVPFLPGGVSHNITSSSVWSSLEQYQSVIVAVAVLISLFSLWFSKPKHSKGKHK